MAYMFPEYSPTVEQEPFYPSLPNVVVVDGPSGVGKGTVRRILAEAIASSGVDVVDLEEKELDEEREEYDRIIEGTKKGGIYDRIIGRSKRRDVDLTLAFIRHRSQYVYPSLTEIAEKHHIVLVTRGEVTTSAYQSARDELSVGQIFCLHREAEIPLPGAIILLGCHPEVAISRIEHDRMREEGLPGDYGGKVTGDLEHRMSIHRQYHEVADVYSDDILPTSVFEIDTTPLPPYEVAERILWQLRDMGLLSDREVERASECIARIELIDTVRNVSLIGNRDVQPYSDAKISLIDVPVEVPLPSARYVLDSNLTRILLLQDELSLYTLDRIIWSRGRPVSPPVLEQFRGNLVILDGLHRFWTARNSGVDTVRSIVIEDVHEDAPIPVLPVPWNEIREVSVVPPNKRVYNPIIDDPSLFYRDLTPLGSGGERRVLTEFGQEVESRLRNIVMYIIGDSRDGFDAPHTEATVKYMKVLLESYPELNEKVMIAAAYFHDIGYSASKVTKWSYGKVIGRKGGHMEDGAKITREILEERFSTDFTQEEIDQIVELVRTHDNVEQVVNTLPGLVLMEADTLGSFEIGGTNPTFSKKELERYLYKNKKRRVGRFKTHTAIRLAKKMEPAIRATIEDMKKIERMRSGKDSIDS